MKTIGRVGLVVFVALLALPLAAQAGHRHHRGGGYGYGGYGGGCGCGAAPVQYAPPAHAQYGEPTPAVAQANAGAYQSFSYSPTPEGDVGMVAPDAAGPVVVNQPYYQAAPMYGQGYNYSGYGYQRSRTHRAYENAINRSLGNNDYGRGR